VRIADILIAQEVEAHVPMIERTAIEIDEELLEQAKTVLGSPTSRATVEEALQRVVTSAEDERNARAERQRTFFETLDTHLDLDVLKSDEMWR
jgi:Arc/MetJ family transcription regulator